MSGVAKQAYYRDAGMPQQLAHRYLQLFGEAARILDVGCGTGEFGFHCAGSGLDVHGVDIDSFAVERAAAHETAVCVDLNSAPLPYADASFDAVLAKDVLEHLVDPARVVGEIKRVLRPGGVVVASVVQARPRRVWADYTHVRGFTRTAASLLFEDAGFDVRALWPMGGVPLSSRLHFVSLVPAILRMPGLAALWASSWEIEAFKPLAAGAPGTVDVESL